MQVTEILTDHTLMALELRGAPEYPIRFYLDIMDQFDRAGIHWHWHPELEFNVITRGTMEYYVENEHHTLTAAQRTDQVRAKQMIAFLQTHFREKLTLDQVAQAASVSRNTCLSCFRRVLGLSPMEYLTQRRLEYALHLLLTSDLPVAQVAEACGFGDASYFGKRFRKQMGLTPSQYRHRHPATRQPFPANGDL